MIKTNDENAGYQPIVPLKDTEDFRTPLDLNVIGDRRDGRIYRYTPQIKLHVNVAAATGRPLLLLGPTGCGKSSLAFNLARVMKRRYYELVVTSRSEARDLFYRFDTVRRLGDVHAAGNIVAANKGDEKSLWESYYPYIEPGPLWWILNRLTASRRGYPGDGTLPFDEATDPAMFVPADTLDAAAVLLIDEIDKAEPDFPNNLLVPLGSQQFTIEELGKSIELRRPDARDMAKSAPLIVITSNRERELPVAFVRRCVVLELPPPTIDDLVEIGKVMTSDDREVDMRAIANKIEELRGAERLSIAEFLDTVRAIDRLDAKEPALAEIIRGTTWRAEDSEE